jgi:hypothetical protein
MTLEWDNIPVYHNWKDQPSYKTMQLSDLLVNSDILLNPRMHARVMLDVDISFEESTYIKETFVEKYNLRELSLVPVRTELLGTTEEINLEIQSVDQIVHQQISNIESNSFDTNILIEIYNNI